jgi:hypothetical protein
MMPTGSTWSHVADRVKVRELASGGGEEQPRQHLDSGESVTP